MKKKKTKIIIAILVVIIIVQMIAIYYLMTSKTEETNTTTTVKQEKVSTQTIENTLTSSGEIQTSSTEKLTLSTSKYFSTMCVEQEDEVKAGENILEYTNGTYLTAPYDCLISSYSVPETGSICTSSNYIEVKNLDTLMMSLSVDETQISKVAKDQEVEITVNAFEDKTYTGTISKISELGTYSTSGTTYTATVTFENTDDNIKLGMSASCTVVLEKAENVIAVPIEAVQTKQDEKYIVIVNSDGSTSEQVVKTGISNDEYVQITEGLTGSETVQYVQTSTTSTRSSNGNSNNQGGMMGGMDQSFGGDPSNSRGGSENGRMNGGTPPTQGQ